MKSTSPRRRASFIRFLPVGLIRSPMTRTRSMGTTPVGQHTAAGTDRGMARMVRPSRARASLAM